MPLCSLPTVGGRMIPLILERCRVVHLQSMCYNRGAQRFYVYSLTDTLNMGESGNDNSRIPARRCKIHNVCEVVGRDARVER